MQLGPIRLNWIDASEGVVTLPDSCWSFQLLRASFLSRRLTSLLDGAVVCTYKMSRMRLLAQEFNIIAAGSQHVFSGSSTAGGAECLEVPVASISGRDGTNWTCNTTGPDTIGQFSWCNGFLWGIFVIFNWTTQGCEQDTICELGLEAIVMLCFFSICPCEDSVDSDELGFLKRLGLAGCMGSHLVATGIDIGPLSRTF